MVRLERRFSIALLILYPLDHDRPKRISKPVNRRQTKYLLAGALGRRKHT
jgi:hypothetical protein